MHADLRKLGVKNGLALLKMESQWFKKVLLIFSSDLIVYSLLTIKSWTVLKPIISSSDRVRVLLLLLDWNDWCSYVCFKFCQLLIMIMFLFLEMLKAQFNISLPTKKCLYKVEIRKFYVIGWYAIINSNI